MAEKDPNQVIQAVIDEYDADIYLYSGVIDDNGFGQIAREVARNKEREIGLLILTTNGGLANSAYQIARLFQNAYDQFILYTPLRCKSAGTIIALGANRLIMSSVFSELGPLDVQLLSRDELGVRKSGLLTRSAFESLSELTFDLFENLMLRIKVYSGNNISFRLASEISSGVTAEIMSSIYGQINPDIVGGDFRDLSVATEYGKRLAERSGNPKSGTVDALVTNYPSHDFIIDSSEAETLFNHVDQPTQKLYNLTGLLSDAISTADTNSIIKAVKPKDPTDGEREPNEHSPNTELQGSGLADSGGASGESDTTPLEGDSDDDQQAPAGDSAAGPTNDAG